MNESVREATVSRRAALRVGALGAVGAAGAAVVWGAPQVHAVSMSAAHAASGPPNRVKGDPPRGPGNNRGKGSGAVKGRPINLGKGPR